MIGFFYTDVYCRRVLCVPSLLTKPRWAGYYVMPLTTTVSTLRLNLWCAICKREEKKLTRLLLDHVTVTSTSDNPNEPDTVKIKRVAVTPGMSALYRDDQNELEQYVCGTCASEMPGTLLVTLSTQ